MFIILENIIITIFLSQNYDSKIPRQLLNSFKMLTILSIIWRSASFITITLVDFFYTCDIYDNSGYTGAFLDNNDVTCTYELFNDRTNIMDSALCIDPV